MGVANLMNDARCLNPLRGRFDWQSELKQRAPSFLFGPCRELAAVPFNNHLTNRQSQSQSFGLRRNERTEDAA
jgi:hypothetical protein